ncbi:hypothetical protein WR25_23665 [Diploscapter pachys]|uniref:Transcription factor CBF/NF-Y/archaeal histone domain-containing protein n=1 Tax=Diploscapter pachys TaxID=2018661 RepID=A0A2A2KSL9_9BILA|nr:hypothetical protein WR25_23665 [Diploscapter pachys]
MEREPVVSPEPTYLTLGEDHNIQHPISHQPNYDVNQEQYYEEAPTIDSRPVISHIQNNHAHSKVLLDQERFLPIANIARIMKKMIPSNGKIAKEAKQCVQECVSEFISFVTSEAHDKCASERRRTVTADDLLEALKATGFDNYADTMHTFLAKYKEAHKTISNTCQMTGLLDGQEQPSATTSNNLENNRSPSMDYCEIVENVEQRHLSNQHQNQNHSTTTINEQPSTSQPTHTYYTTQMSEENQQNTAQDQNTVVMMNGDYGGQQVVEAQGQTMQIYLDPATKQYYAAYDNNGVREFYPVIIQNGDMMNSDQSQAIEQNHDDYQPV